MFLVVDYEDLDSVEMDIKITNEENFTVGELRDKICAGIEKLANIKIDKKSEMNIFNRSGLQMNNAMLLTDADVDDWDTIYLTRGVKK